MKKLIRNKKLLVLFSGLMVLIIGVVLYCSFATNQSIADGTTDMGLDTKLHQVKDNIISSNNNSNDETTDNQNCHNKSSENEGCDNEVNCSFDNSQSESINNDYDFGNDAFYNNNNENQNNSESTQHQADAHVHSWLAHYETRQYQTGVKYVVDRPAIYKSVTCCNVCGAKDVVYGVHQCNDGCFSSHSERITIQAEIGHFEPVYQTENFIDYYYCSGCGCHK